MLHSPMTEVDSPDYMSSDVWSDESYPETISSASDYHGEQISENGKSKIDDEEQNTSKRTKKIVISIIILLSLMVIAMIITLVIFLKSNNTNDKTGTWRVTTSVHSVVGATSTRGTPITYEVGNGGVSSDPPCLSHTVMNDPLRNIKTSGIGGTCDTGPFFNTSIGGRWIRFMGTGGTKITLTHPGPNHCGAFITGWFNGSLPSVIGTTVDGLVSFTSPGITRLLFVPVSVLNCGSFYVYLLPPLLMCNSRYCTD